MTRAEAARRGLPILGIFRRQARALAASGVGAAGGVELVCAEGAQPCCPVARPWR